MCNADLEALPFGDGVFDACHCAMALHHVERPEAAVAEMSRVVRPGGRIMLTAFCPHEQAWMREELAHSGWASRGTRSRITSAAGGSDARRLADTRPAAGATVPGRARPEPQPRWPDVFLATGHQATDERGRDRMR